MKVFKNDFFLNYHYEGNDNVAVILDDLAHYEDDQDVYDFFIFFYKEKFENKECGSVDKKIFNRMKESYSLKHMNDLNHDESLELMMIFTRVLVLRELKPYYDFKSLLHLSFSESFCNS